VLRGGDSLYARKIYASLLFNSRGKPEGKGNSSKERVRRLTETLSISEKDWPVKVANRGLAEGGHEGGSREGERRKANSDLSVGNLRKWARKIFAAKGTCRVRSARSVFS